MMFIIDFPVFVLHCISIFGTLPPTILTYLVFSLNAHNPTYSQERIQLCSVQNGQEVFQAVLSSLIAWQWEVSMGLRGNI